MLCISVMTIRAIVERAHALNRLGQYEAAYDLCADALEHGVDHTAIRIELARALAGMGCEREWRVVLLGAMIRWRRRGTRGRWARSWVSTTGLDQRPAA